MKTIIITGSGGLIGKEASLFFHEKGYRIIGIDNNYREVLFGKEGSVNHNLTDLTVSCPNYVHYPCDIRDTQNIEKVFLDHSSDIVAIIHCAAQPSHDWAVKDVFVDYQINSTATLSLLEMTKKYCHDATFIFMSTNKVYGDNPNRLTFIETDTRWELKETHPYFNGVDESFSTDNTTHSLFGCSKLSADLYVQEYARYFGMKTVVFRGGCLTGSQHSGTELHGFLNYLVKCNIKTTTYNMFGYKGKQVRDNIHASDLINAFDQVIENPISGVYNIGGGRESNCSMIEAMKIIEARTHIPFNVNYVESNRIGDHIWWISNLDKFKKCYPTWKITYTIPDIISEIISNVHL